MTEGDRPDWRDTGDGKIRYGLWVFPESIVDRLLAERVVRQALKDVNRRIGKPGVPERQSGGGSVVSWKAAKSSTELEDATRMAQFLAVLRLCGPLCTDEIWRGLELMLGVRFNKKPNMTGVTNLAYIGLIQMTGDERDGESINPHTGKPYSQNIWVTTEGMAAFFQSLGDRQLEVARSRLEKNNKQYRSMLESVFKVSASKRSIKQLEEVVSEVYVDMVPLTKTQQIKRLSQFHWYTHHLIGNPADGEIGEAARRGFELPVQWDENGRLTLKPGWDEEE